MVNLWNIVIELIRLSNYRKHKNEKNVSVHLKFTLLWGFCNKTVPNVIVLSKKFVEKTNHPNTTSLKLQNYTLPKPHRRMGNFSLYMEEMARSLNHPSNWKEPSKLIHAKEQWETLNLKKQNHDNPHLFNFPVIK